MTVFSNEPELICLHTVKCIMLFLSDTYKFIKYNYFLQTWLNGFKYYYLIGIIL